ncbi:hypothetical protein [Streptomyces sp. WMMC940]|uniref:hypothetical protein n=1 Tax=Streptomyces sp. WMMC940 TaxID=3015153 RepID=UPI0022B6D8D3|nr:hypothetical protein [Streptomyces sp. WMMC940]MCZ7456270.1 hypothetical protein [Streptomyces sp. WMMC940]
MRTAPVRHRLAPGAGGRREEVTASRGCFGSDVLSGFGSITVDYDEGVLEISAP